MIDDIPGPRFTSRGPINIDALVRLKLALMRMGRVLVIMM